MFCFQRSSHWGLVHLPNTHTINRLCEALTYGSQGMTSSKYGSQGMTGSRYGSQVMTKQQVRLVYNINGLKQLSKKVSLLIG